MLKIRQLIKRVRACKTAEEERSVINKESAEIRNASKDINNPHKARDLCKAIYMQMMGYQTSFMQLSCINLLASKDFQEKRIAYSALSLVCDYSSQVLLLATASIKKDLENTESPESIALALNAIGDICTKDMCNELGITVANLLSSSNDANIKKKAACAATYIIRKCPELIDNYIDKVPNLLEDKTHSVCLTGINLALEIIRQKPEFISKIKKFHGMFVKYEKSLLSISYAPEFDVNGITDPFLQAKILEIMKFTAKNNKVLCDELGDLFVSVQSITEASKQTGYALQYEIVRTINKLEANAGMKSLSNNILGKFLGSKDLNLKYIALNTLQDVARYDIGSVTKHKNLILEFLKDKDISLQKRALDLIYLIINNNNLKSIAKECIKYLPNAPIEIKFELTSKLVDSIEKYSSSYKWEIDTLIKMVIVSDSKLYDDALSKIINIIMSTKELFIYSVHKLYICLKNNKENKALSIIAFYVIGENGRLLIDNAILNSKNENIKVSEDEVIELFKEIGKINNEKGNYEVLEYLLNAYVKLLLKFPNKRNDIDEDILKYKKSFYYEVQQRAVEYEIFDKIKKEELKRNVVNSIPTPKTKEENYNREIFNEKDEEENKDDDPLNSIKFNSIPIQSSSNNAVNDIFQENVNNGNVNKKENDNNGLNLLDLNNIFGNNPSSDNNPINNNPIDLLGDSNNNNPLNLLANTNNNPIDLFGNQSNNNPIDFLNNNNNNNDNDNDNNNNNNNNNNNPLDLLGNNNNNTEKNEENKVDDLLNLMGNLSPSQSNNNNPIDFNMINQPTNILENHKNNIIQSEQQLKQCFSNENISLFYKIIPSKENPLFYNGEVIASNNSSSAIDNIKINFLVLKFITLKIGEVTGSHLNPNQSLGLKKTFTLQSNDPNKKIVIKIKLSYSIDGKDETTMITLDNI